MWYRLQLNKKGRVTLMDIQIQPPVWVDLDEMEEGPGPYTMSYGFNLDVLCESIRKVGLLNSPLERFLVNFYENVAFRKFSDIEKAMILKRLRGYVQKEEILASFMPLLSLPSHEGTLEFYLKLGNLEESFQN